MAAARRIVAARAVVPVAHGAHPGRAGDRRGAAGLAIGGAYSLPAAAAQALPARSPSLCITFVRSVVVNLGVALHFAGTPVPRGRVGADALRRPVLVRDRGAQGRPRHRGRPALPDRDLLGPARRPRPCCAGPRRPDARLSRHGRRSARCCSTAPAGRARGTHLLGVAALLRAGLRADPADPVAFTRFYMTVWKPFFREYLLVPLAFFVSLGVEHDVALRPRAAQQRGAWRRRVERLGVVAHRAGEHRRPAAVAGATRQPDGAWTPLASARSSSEPPPTAPPPPSART